MRSYAVNAFSRYENGKNKPPLSLVKLLKMLDRHPELGVSTDKGLLNHPKVGASWEGFVIEQILMNEPHDEAFFWATHQGAEIDLILRQGDRLLGVECKRADVPRLTPSIRTALADLGLERVAVVYPGVKRYSLADKVEAVALQALGSGDRIFHSLSYQFNNLNRDNLSVNSII